MAFIDFTPQEDGFVDFNKPAKLDPRDSQSDFMTGLKDTFKQLPELGWGIASITASGIESLAGEGGLATAAKNFSVNKYQDWQKDIAATHKDAYDFDKAYDSATKEGNFGALVDFLQYGVGYAVGQGAQVLATAGVGKVIGQLAIKPAVEKMAAGLVAKQAVKIAGEGASAEAIAAAMPAAVKEIAGTIGQHAAMAAYSFGMEGGEIGGDLAEKSVKENRALTSGELMRGLGATMLAGTMEYGENLIGLAGMKGKLPSPFSATAGVGGRIGRAATGALVAAPVEGVTEYGQTIAEEYGKGNEQTLNPFSISAATHRQGINAAALGVIGGTVHAGGGGLLSSPKPSGQEILDAKNVDEATAKAQASVLESDLNNAADAVSGMLDQQQFQQVMARPDPVAATFTASPVDLTPGGVAQDAAPVSADDAYAQAAQAEDKARRIAAYAAQQSNAGGDPVALAITQADAANARQAAIEDNPPIETAMQREIRKLRELQAARKESQNGAIPDATDAEMATPSAQAKSGKLPGGASVSGSAPAGNAGAISSSAEVAASSVRPSVSTGYASASGVKNQPEQAKQSAAKVAPNKKRNDLVGAILRVTGGDGLSPSMALDTTGDNASGATKLRGLFTNKGTTDLGEVAQRLREEEGYSVRDGEHLAELIRKQASGERVTSSRSIEEDAAEAENAAWRNNVTEEARSMGLKGPGGKRTIEMVDADIRRVLAERSAMNASEARVAAQAESMFADGQDMTEADLMRWFAQPANYTEEDINNAEQYQADREDARDAANAAIDSEVAAQSRTGERAENGRAQEGTRATNEGLTLTGQTNDQASAEYRAQQEEANRKDEAPASPTVKADQIDLFNTQGSVFDQPPDAVAQATATLKAAGVTGTDLTSTIAAVRRGDLTPEEVADAHPPQVANETSAKYKTRTTSNIDMAQQERAVYAVKEPSSVSGDLFQGTENALQKNQGNDLQGARKKTARDAGFAAKSPARVLAVRESADAPGIYHVSTQLVTVGERKIPVKTVQSWDDASKSFAHLARFAVEHMDGLVTDKNGKPLAIIGAFKGAPTQASVYPSTVMMELARIDGAANLWLSHNHPSGVANLSDADRMLSRQFEKILKDTSVRYRGLSAMARSGNNIGWINTDNDYGEVDSSQPADHIVPIVEREIVESNPQQAVASPGEAKRLVVEIAKNTPGVVFLTSQHNVSAFVPLPPETMGELRPQDRLMRLFNAAAKSGAGAALIAMPDGKVSREQFSNIKGALGTIDVRVLDGIEYRSNDGGNINSLAERGLDKSKGADFYSTSRSEPIARTRSEQLIADGDLDDLANQTFPDIDGSDTNQGATKPEPLPDAPMADNRTAAYTIQKTLAAKIGSVPAITIHTGMAPAGTISRSTFKAINAVAKIFKQRVVYFQSDRATVDGFVQDGVVYLNVDSSVSPLAVMGHELTHRLQQEQPEAWHAVAQVLAGRMDQAKLLAMYRSYNGGTMTDAQIIEQLQDEKALEDLMAEMVSDYAGNQFTDETFWGDVFGQIASAHPEGMAKRLIERLRTAVMKMVGLMNKAINQPGFAKTWLVGEENTAEWGKDVNAALKTAYAQWIDAISQDGYQAVQEAAAAKFSPGWHGSPYDHDGFDSSKIGTGEGAQAYGWGHYFAGNKAVAEYYRNQLTTAGGPEFIWRYITESTAQTGGISRFKTTDEVKDFFKDLAEDDSSYLGVAPSLHDFTGVETALMSLSNNDAFAEEIISANKSFRNVKKIRDVVQAAVDNGDKSRLQEYMDLRKQAVKASEYIDSIFKREIIKAIPKGRLYQVDLKPAEDEYLLWDKPLTEQSEKVKAAILDAAGRLSSPDALSGSSWATGGWGKGESFYKKLSGEVGGDKAASKYLHSIGIRGIRYLDGSSRDLSGTQWKEGADPTQYHKLTKGVAENYLRERGDVADAIARLNRDAEASGAKQYADAAKALESGDLVQKLNHNYVIFDDKDVTIEAKFSNRRNATEAPTSAGDGSTESATKIPAPEIPRKLSQKQFEGILQDIDGYGPIEADDPYRIQEFRSIVKRLKSAGVDFIDMYHVTDASLKEFDSDGILGSSVSDIGRPGVNERDSSVYGFLDPDDIKKSYNGILGSSSETPNVVHIKVPVDRIGDLRWDGNFNVTYGAYSGIRFIGDIPSNWISGIYSHAIKNEPSTSAGSAKFSTARIVGDSGRTYTPEQQAMFKVTGREVNDLTTLEKLKQWTSKKWVQGIVDQFAPIKDIDLHAYTLTRLSKGATGAFEAFMGHGKLSIKDGAYDADTSGGVMQEVFFPLGKETTDFLYWIAGNRAERLAAEGKERLFSRADIDAAKSLAAGTADFDYTLQNGNVTRDRTKIYADSLVKFNEFNKNIMDMAEQSGLIDGASRHLWEHEFYVPFYRLADDKDGGVRGMNIKKGVVRQQAFKKLKGGTEGLNDLLANTLMNWAHLIDASAKNRAAKATLDAAQAIGISRPVAANMAQYAASNGAMLPPGTKNTVWYSDKGNKQEFTVDDPHLIIALNGLDFSGLRGPVMDALSKTKHWLTIGVTASPFFKIRNLIRDSVQAVGTSGLGYNVFANVAEGARLTNRDNAEYVSALAGGGLIRFGTMLENNEAARARQLIKKGAKDSHILDNESKVRQFYDKFLSPGVSAYNELGNRGEDINRMALYHQLMKQGMSHADASLQARDLMDFSMQGSFTTIRFLTQTVPFMNARLQGLHKLGRAAKEDPAKFAIVTGMVALASLALLAAYGDDDDWKKREDWDRDNYWWFKFGGEAFRIPKPFEIGAIGTLAERSAEYIFDKEMTGKRFAKVTSNLVWSQLAMNPVPQMVKPIIDIYSNKDSFSGRPIETMGMEKLDKEYRFNANTSMVARGLSTGTGGALSPVQIDSLVRGYFSWLGTFAVGTADLAVRAASNEPTRPTLDYWKLATGGMVADLDSGSSRYVSQMYEQAKILEEAHGTLNALRKQGKTAEAQEYLEDNKEKLQKYSQVEHVKKSEAKLSERIRVIERSNMQPDEKRDLVIQIRKQQDQLARRVN